MGITTVIRTISSQFKSLKVRTFPIQNADLYANQLGAKKKPKPSLRAARAVQGPRLVAGCPDATSPRLGSGGSAPMLGDPAALLVEMKASEPVLHCWETEAMLTLWTQWWFLTTAEAGYSEMACDSAFPILPTHRQKKKRQHIQAPLSD